MTYLNMLEELEKAMHPAVWKDVSYYLKKAKNLYDNGEKKRARDSMEDAIAVAQSIDEYDTARRIKKYLRFFK